jgi:hypothetical protein
LLSNKGHVAGALLKWVGRRADRLFFVLLIAIFFVLEPTNYLGDPAGGAAPASRAPWTSSTGWAPAPALVHRPDHLDDQQRRADALTTELIFSPTRRRSA